MDSPKAPRFQVVLQDLDRQQVVEDQQDVDSQPSVEDLLDVGVLHKVVAMEEL